MASTPLKMAECSNSTKTILSSSTLSPPPPIATAIATAFPTLPPLRRRRLFPKACSTPPHQQPQQPPLLGGDRRRFLAQSLSLSLIGCAGAAKSEDLMSEWEPSVPPIDPGVVLLDIAFVPDEPNHGFLLGTRQTVLETKDGGETWVPLSIASAEEEDFNYRFNSISFRGKEGWIVGKPAILLYTSDAAENWKRIPLSAQLPGDMVYIKATGEKSAEMVTDRGAIYNTSNGGYNWRAAVQETVSATLNRTVSSGIIGASYHTGTFNTVNRSPDGRYVAVSSRGNFYLTWEPG